MEERSDVLVANGNTFVLVFCWGFLLFFFFLIFRLFLFCSLKQRTSESIPNVFVTTGLKIYILYIYVDIQKSGSHMGFSHTCQWNEYV